MFLLTLRGNRSLYCFLCRRSSGGRFFQEASPSQSFDKTPTEIQEPNTGRPSHDFTRNVPRTITEFKDQNIRKPMQPTDPRFLRVFILGEPNAGKSSLTNQLTGWRVCSVSAKVHTTRHNAQTVLSVDDTQIVFTDTPGVVTTGARLKHKLEPSLVSHPQKASNADLIAVVVDASNRWTRTRLDSDILKQLVKHEDKKSILILNKIDLVKQKESLLEFARGLCNGVILGKPYGHKQTLRLATDTELKETLMRNMKNLTTVKARSNLDNGWSYFQKIFMVSALTRDGIRSILDYLIESAPKGPWEYHPSIVIDQQPQDLAKMVVREKLLDKFDKEIGYILKVRIDTWEIDDADSLRVEMTIKCPRKNLVTIVTRSIAGIGDASRKELANMFHCEVSLKLRAALATPDK